jgi:hypothetical protein
VEDVFTGTEESAGGSDGATCAQVNEIALAPANPAQTAYSLIMRRLIIMSPSQLGAPSKK